MAWSGFIGLGTVSGGVFSELANTDYARQAFAFADPVADKVAGIGGAIDFPRVTAGVAWTYGAYAFFSAVTGGTPVLVYPHTTSATVSPGTAHKVTPSRISVDIAANTTHMGIVLSPTQVARVSGFVAPAAQGVLPTLRRKLAVAGDSYEGNNYSFVNGAHFLLNGTVSALNTVARQAFEIDINNAFFVQNGSGASYIMQQLPGIVAYRPDYLIFAAGHNDFISGDSLALVISHMTTIIQTCQAAGITPIMCLTPPQNTNQSSVAVTLQQLQRLIVSLNQWKRAYCAANNLPLWDWYTPMVDSSATGGGYAVGMVNAGDNIHPGYKGSMAAAKQGLLDLAAILPPGTTSLTRDVGDVYDATYSPYGNLYANALFWTTGSAQSNPLSGTAPGSWNGSRTAGAAAGGTIAMSLVAASDGIGQWCQLAVSGATTGGTTNEQISLSQQINASGTTFATGDVVEVWMEVNVSAASPFKAISVQFQDNNGNAVVATPSAGNQASAGELTGPAYAWSGVVRTPPYTVTPYFGSGTQRLFTQILVTWDGSGNNFAGTVQFRRPTMRKLVSV